MNNAFSLDDQFEHTLAQKLLHMVMEFSAHDIFIPSWCALCILHYNHHQQDHTQA